MKKLTLATLSTLALTVASTNVFAVDGTITVKGAVTDQTCTLQGDGRFGSSGLKDITINIRALPKSWFLSNQGQWIQVFNLFLKNAEGTANCDAATGKAFKGIHLSVTSPATNLDATDKTLLVNQAEGASATNPIFIQLLTVSSSGFVPVDLSAPWGDQATSPILGDGTDENIIYVYYQAKMFSKTGIVDAQTVQATVNYTMHYN
ncbi:type 1 fimbrial protein [Acinetobacter sp. NyZ410]|uniref:fimbrial protein n=1 Tax=Acinetobacter sp. NyZ410 TaxID=2929509 RepID=UPI001FBAEF9D|nr:type 1 fimbrial protein [Acinetobacter sp. NyZ410]UOH17289.1 type 1 fimbrial protein [Acinetobacter sp. NyZ410]